MSFGSKTDFVWIGYAWPDRPKVVYSNAFSDYQSLCNQGYSVDGIPRALALEIDALWDAVPVT